MSLKRYVSCPLFTSTFRIFQCILLYLTWSWQVEFKAVFIDAMYRKENRREFRREPEEFKKNTEALWKFAQEAQEHPFDCKDIETALTEIQTLDKTSSELKNQLQEKEQEIKEKEEQLKSQSKNEAFAIKRLVTINIGSLTPQRPLGDIHSHLMLVCLDLGGAIWAQE